ncbi:unnamed protein product [Amoebophrya sp. A120]|nr:unnamed protein product [Amoebophrya sp. A120]|eukprot:GSA120T00000019001.1
MLDRTFRGQVFVTVAALFFFTTHHQHGISGVRLVAAVSVSCETDGSLAATDCDTALGGGAAGVFAVLGTCDDSIDPKTDSGVYSGSTYQYDSPFLRMLFCVPPSKMVLHRSASNRASVR